MRLPPSGIRLIQPVVDYQTCIGILPESIHDDLLQFRKIILSRPQHHATVRFAAGKLDCPQSKRDTRLSEFKITVINIIALKPFRFIHCRQNRFPVQQQFHPVAVPVQERFIVFPFSQDFINLLSGIGKLGPFGQIGRSRTGIIIRRQFQIVNSDFSGIPRQNQIEINLAILFRAMGYHPLNPFTGI